MGHKRVKRVLVVLALLVAALACMPVRAMADGAVSRGAWLERLVDTFDVTVAEEDYPDNYYTDVDSTSPHYLAVMRAVNFGIVDLEGGQDFRPDDPLTRELRPRRSTTASGTSWRRGRTIPSVTGPTWRRTRATARR